MPIDYSKYPDNWKTEIRPKILRRAGGREDKPEVGAKCEKCGKRNYSVVSVSGEFKNNSYRAAQMTKTLNGGGKIVVLTIAHINDPDPMNCAEDNLMALCQKCHNGHDAEMRAKNRKKKNRIDMIDAGQMELFG